MSRVPLSVAPVQGALGAPGRAQYQFPSYEDGVHWTDTLGPCSTRPLKRSELAELKKKSSSEIEALQNDLKASKQTLRDTQLQQEAQLSALKEQVEAAKAKGKEALDAQRKRSAEREHKALKEHKATVEDLQKQLREALEENAQS